MKKLTLLTTIALVLSVLAGLALAMPAEQVNLQGQFGPIPGEWVLYTLPEGDFPGGGETIRGNTSFVEWTDLEYPVFLLRGDAHTRNKVREYLMVGPGSGELDLQRVPYTCPDHWNDVLWFVIFHLGEEGSLLLCQHDDHGSCAGGQFLVEFPVDGEPWVNLWECVFELPAGESFPGTDLSLLGNTSYVSATLSTGSSVLLAKDNRYRGGPLELLEVTDEVHGVNLQEAVVCLDGTQPYNDVLGWFSWVGSGVLGLYAHDEGGQPAGGPYTIHLPGCLITSTPTNTSTPTPTSTPTSTPTNTSTPTPTSTPTSTPTNTSTPTPTSTPTSTPTNTPTATPYRFYLPLVLKF